MPLALWSRQCPVSAIQTDVNAALGYVPVGNVGDTAEVERHSNVERTQISRTHSGDIATAVQP